MRVDKQGAGNNAGVGEVHPGERVEEVPGDGVVQRNRLPQPGAPGQRPPVSGCQRSLFNDK